MKNSTTFLLDLNDQNDKFKNFLLMSALIHLSIFLSIGLKGLLFSSRTIDLSKAIRVDVVALPEKLNERPVAEPEPAAEPAPAQTKPVEKKSNPVEVKKDNSQALKESQQKALEKLRALEALEKMKKEVSGRDAKAQQQPKAKAPPYKGQVISSGNSFTGISRLRVNDYLESLTQKVRENWELPQWLSSANLKAVIIVSVDSRGYVVKNEIHTSSGNSVFDASCVAAVKNSSPFTEPPEEVQEALLLIRFPFE